eukprot:4596001-Heterocapsa_arctica.AAC.1
MLPTTYHCGQRRGSARVAGFDGAFRIVSGLVVNVVLPGRLEDGAIVAIGVVVLGHLELGRVELVDTY